LVRKRDLPAIEGGRPVFRKKFTTHGFGLYLYGKEELDNIKAVIRAKSPFRYYGVEVQHFTDKFEKAFAKMCKVKYALGVTSGSAALHVSLGALGVEKGDEVLVTALTWISDGFAPIWCGARPVIVDVDPNTLCINPEDVEDNITKQTKVVIAVDYFGYPADADKLMKICEEHEVYLLEDASHAHGASYKGRMTGGLGHIAAFSCQLHKIITSGEGGVVTTNDDELYERAYRFHDLGMLYHKQPFATVGFQYRMTELQGALLYAQVKKLRKIVNGNRKAARAIEKGIKKEIGKGPIFREEKDVKQVYYGLLLKPDWENLKIEGEEFIQALAREGVEVWRVNRPLYKADALKGIAKVPYAGGMCKEAEKAYKEWFALPVYPGMKEREIEGIVRAFTKIYKYYSKK